MACKNKVVNVKGIVSKDKDMKTTSLICMITNDSRGKTLSISAEGVQFVIPFEPLEKYLK